MASDRSFQTRLLQLLPPMRKLQGWVTSLSLANIKYILFTSALALLACFTILNQIFISNLESQALQINDKEARLYAVAIAEQLNREEINVIFNEIVRKSQVPMVITDNQNVPINWNNISYKFWSKGKSKVPQVPFYYLAKAEQEFLLKLVKNMDKKNQPLELEAEGHTFGFLHYGEFTLVHILAWMPMVEMFIILLFCFVGYFGFHIIRSNEQSVLWVGLAKETAHQLGTPISSLLGWIDFLRMKLESVPDSEKNLRILGEMESDISRLNRVATRFSQIGSTPELKKQDLNEIIGFTANYFASRLPHLGKRINIELKLEDLPEVWINRELMGWVVENLIRNAVDSIEVEAGVITIGTHYASEEEMVHISLSDNGKGIPREHVKHIFNPGFTTKKRGWGLGLSLCRRIVNEYHSGKIYVEKSQKDVGTQFEIVLPLAPDRTTRKKS
ncbi:MAG: integral rane sensor signal transduction histidine kinase [Fibrobacteres bacterium]|nr:integral rane sensor signal transduction histidine kinase [Fibrobacterota bacterium]